MDTENIDSNGFRENVGIILFNSENKLLLASRIGKKGWQFPQVGIHISENPEKAMYRELYEEIGLEQNDVTIIDKTKEWLKYQLPDQYIRKDSKIHCIGQKQIWFLLRLNCDEAKISLQRTDNPEFEYWQWMKDEPLTKHPQTGQPVRRVISGGISISSKNSCCATSTGSCCG